MPSLIASKLIAGRRAASRRRCVRRAATLALDWDMRQKSRFEATDSQGRRIGVFLPRGSVVRGGDVLVAEDGSLVARAGARAAGARRHALRRRRAARRSTCCAPPTTSATGTCRSRCAPTACELEPDHVLAEMLRAHGPASSRRRAAPFEPGGGAYDAAAAHGSCAWRQCGAITITSHDHDHARPRPLARPRPRSRARAHDHGQHPRRRDDDPAHVRGRRTARRRRSHGARARAGRASGRRRSRRPRCCS